MISAGINILVALKANWDRLFILCVVIKYRGLGLDLFIFSSCLLIWFENCHLTWGPFKGSSFTILWIWWSISGRCEGPMWITSPRIAQKLGSNWLVYLNQYNLAWVTWFSMCGLSFCSYIACTKRSMFCLIKSLSTNRMMSCQHRSCIVNANWKLEEEINICSSGIDWTFGSIFLSFNRIILFSSRGSLIGNSLWSVPAPER